MHKSQHRIRNHTEIHDNMLPPKITNPIIMDSNGNDQDETLDREFKRIIIIMSNKAKKKR